MTITIGQKINKWTVLELDSSNSTKRYYLCKCDCGNIKSVYYFNLLNGKSKSCGCFNQKVQDSIDKRYGMLTVIKEDVDIRKQKPKRQRYLWCRCDCGVEKSIRADVLWRGDTKSCGAHYLGKTSPVEIENYKNKVIGEWTILEKDLSRRGLNYICRCSCGNTKSVPSSLLRIGSGYGAHCGCKSWLNGRKYIYKIPTGHYHFYKGYKKGALKRKLSWELTEEEAYSLFLLPCFYCTLPPESRKASNYIFNSSGIDRVNNKIGYIKDNCVSCCTDCNLAKNNNSQNYFYKWIERVSNSLKIKNLIN